MTKISALTICSFNYISKARVLIESYKTIHPEHDITLVIVDKKRESSTLQKLGINIIWAEDLPIDNFFQYAFTFDIIEFNTNVKPTAMKFLLEKYDKVIYFDPDIQVFSSIDHILEELNNASIVITPHSVTPILDGCKPDDSDLLRFGAYNLGFVGVSKCSESFSFLEWWSDRCLKLGFYEPQLGLAVDQKWIDLAPSFFPKLKILHNVGLNVAFWNLHERFLSKVNNQWFVNGNIPLVFFHFSSFNSDFVDVIAFKQTRFKQGERSDFTEIANEYAVNIQKLKISEFDNQKYGFDYFNDGVYINPVVRRFYVILKNDLFEKDNPFEVNNNFRKFVKKHGLIKLKQAINHKRITFKDLENYKNQEKFFLIGLKLILRILGPEKYFSLMRYLPHISSIRNQRKLFSK
jgi:hypothetical protein